MNNFHKLNYILIEGRAKSFSTYSQLQFFYGRNLLFSALQIKKHTAV